jgi:mono/diheme cytochrome c family protein
MWGFLFVAGWALSTFSFSVIILAWLSNREPMNRIIGKRHFHDIGKLMLAFTMVWAYFNFSQYLIIWSGNIPEITKELVDRGEERYRIFCMVCHGPVGNGDGMIVRRGFPQPPTYNDDRLRNAPVGHFFDVITNGWGKMNSYASQIPPADRWAIVAYIRTLQISQNPNGNLAMPSSRGANTTNTNTTTNPTELPKPVGLPNSPTQGGTR